MAAVSSGDTGRGPSIRAKLVNAARQRLSTQNQPRNTGTQTCPLWSHPDRFLAFSAPELTLARWDAVAYSARGMFWTIVAERSGKIPNSHDMLSMRSLITGANRTDRLLALGQAGGLYERCHKQRS
jgi:hypothetical protein